MKHLDPIILHTCLIRFPGCHQSVAVFPITQPLLGLWHPTLGLLPPPKHVRRLPFLSRALMPVPSCPQVNTILTLPGLCQPVPGHPTAGTCLTLLGLGALFRATALSLPLEWTLPHLAWTDSWSGPLWFQPLHTPTLLGPTGHFLTELFRRGLM